MRKRRDSPLAQKRRKRSGSSFDGCPQGNGRTHGNAPAKSAVYLSAAAANVFSSTAKRRNIIPLCAHNDSFGVRAVLPGLPAIPPSAKTAGKSMAERRHQFSGGTLPLSHTDEYGKPPYHTGDPAAAWCILQSVPCIVRIPGSLRLSGSVCYDPSRDGGQVPCGHCW